MKSLTEQEVRQQVKPTPAHLPVVKLPKSGKGPQNQQGLIPSYFCRCSTILLFVAQTDAYFWLLVSIACLWLKMVTDCNQQFGDEAGMLPASLLVGQTLQITRKRRRIRLQLKPLALGKGRMERNETKIVVSVFIHWNWILLSWGLHPKVHQTKKIQTQPRNTHCRFISAWKVKTHPTRATPVKEFVKMIPSGTPQVGGIGINYQEWASQSGLLAWNDTIAVWHM